MSVVISMNCLRNESGDPLYAGLKLLDAMSVNGRCVISLEERDEKASSEVWLSQRNLRVPYALRDDVLYGVPRFLRHVELERFMGTVELAISADAADVKSCFDIGIPSLLFVDSRIIDPRRRPDGPRPWDEVVDSIDGRFR